MKKLLILLTLFFVFTGPVFAATPQPKADRPLAETTKTTTAPTDESKANFLNKQITELKDKIASQVAKLKLVDKRGITGTVVSATDTQITLTDAQEKNRIVDIDEITKFSSDSAKTFGISDISKGMTLNVVGLYNKQTRRILARFIDSTVIPKFVSGVITDVDLKNYTISILDAHGTTTVVDIEKITKTDSYTKDGDIVKSGFSKLEEGQRVVVTAYPEKGEKNRLSGLRILVLPEAPKDPNISFTASAGDTPTTGAKKATPTP